jgi:hypothetical protein
MRKGALLNSGTPSALLDRAAECDSRGVMHMSATCTSRAVTCVQVSEFVMDEEELDGTARRGIYKAESFDGTSVCEFGFY